MRKVLYPITFFLAAHTMAASATNTADKDKTPWYQADMIVFLHENGVNRRDQPGTEQWPTIQPYYFPKNALRLTDPPAAPVLVDQLLDMDSWLSNDRLPMPVDMKRDAFIQLPSASHQLLKAGNTLERQPGYRVLQRSAWIMPIPDGTSTPPIAVEGVNLSKDWGSLVEGTVTVSSSRYMHVFVNLWYSTLTQESLSTLFAKHGSTAINDNGSQKKDGAKKKHVQEKKGAETQTVQLPDGRMMRITGNFQLKENRRITDEEQIHYLDTPVIGVLFKLTPYERPEKPLIPEMI